VASMDPSNVQACHRAATLMLKLGMDLKEARLLAQRAVDQEPKNASYRFVLAMILVQADMKKLAKAQLEELLKLSPNHAEAKKQLRRMRWPF
jgi:cytochrome c-type biogenesis protein CcmH/NrfG